MREYEVEEEENVWIELRDFRRLSARIWRPIGVLESPVILEYLPYRKRDGTLSRDETTHAIFARYGYACVRVDISGTGDSDGEFDDEYSEQELRDGEEVISWIVRQDWCDGSVGMIGISWGGFNGLQLAFRRPEGLKAVVSVASSTDRYEDDIHYMGGCLLSENFNWGNQMFAYQTRPPDPLLRDDWREVWLWRMNNSRFLSVDWLSHQTRDEYWKRGSVCEDWGAIEVPVLGITGWSDSYVNTPSLLSMNLSGVSKGLVGAWEHRYSHLAKLNPGDFHGEVINWFDRWLKGIENGVEDLPAYRVFMQEFSYPSRQNRDREGFWVSEESLPSENVEKLDMFLGEGSRLGYEGDEGLSRGFVDICSLCHLGESSSYFTPGMRVDNELSMDQRGDDLLSEYFETEVFEEDLELLGRARLYFSFSVDRPFGQLVFRLCEVSGSGVSYRISYRALNLCHYVSHEGPERLEEGRYYDSYLDLNECGHRLRAGHRLRLSISSSYWPVVWPSPYRTRVRLDLSGCRLSLPVRRGGGVGSCEIGCPIDFMGIRGGVEFREELEGSSSSYRQFTGLGGERIWEALDNYGREKYLGHGMEVGSNVFVRYSIHPEDPLTARCETSWNFEFRRGDWYVEVYTENEMTCDEENFYLVRKLRAVEGGEEVLCREWREVVERGFL